MAAIFIFEKKHDISIMLWPTAAKFGTFAHFDIPHPTVH